MVKKIKMLVVPSDRTGVGKFRSVDPHVYIANHYGDEFDVDIVYKIPSENTSEFLRKYDLIHIHKQLDKEGKCIDLIKFLGIPLIVDVDDHFILGEFHPMAFAANKDKWHEPIVNALRKADLVTTTTPIYAKYLRKLNDNVAVLPNGIDKDEAQYSTAKVKSDKLRIGILCGSSHLHDLELLHNVTKYTAQSDKIQTVLCGFDIRGTNSTYNADGTITTRSMLPQETVWSKYERILTDDYRYLSPKHRQFLLNFIPNVDDPFSNEGYRRFWTKSVQTYGKMYENIDVLLAPLKDNEFNKMKSQLKAIECGFTNTALIAQDFGPYTLDLTNYIEKGGNVQHSANAMLVPSTRNHKDWLRNIKYLVEHPESVDELKSNLHDAMVPKYELGVICEKRVNEYRKLLGLG